MAACDRWNYGDLLFPILVPHLLHETGENSFRSVSYGLTDEVDIPADAARVLPISRIDRSHAVVVGGGDVLNVEHWLARKHLNQSWTRSDRLLHRVRRPLFLARMLRERWFGHAGPLAYLYDGVRHHGPLVFNALGGGNLLQFPPATQAWIGRTLDRADYVSVRDKKTLENVEVICSRNRVDLVPDWAVLLSEVIPKRLLFAPSSYRPSFPQQPYAVFQCSRAYLADVSLLAERLDAVYAETGCPIVLLPIGVAPGHSDQEALKKISDQMRGPSVLVERPTILEVISIISHAKFFAGSSLHGCITAISYDVPYVPLAKPDSKVATYLDSWDFSPTGVDPCGLTDAVAQVLSQDRGPNRLASQHCKSLVLAAATRLRSILLRRREMLM